MNSRREILRGTMALLDGDAHPVLSTLLRCVGGTLVVLGLFSVLRLLGA